VAGRRCRAALIPGPSGSSALPRGFQETMQLGTLAGTLRARRFAVDCDHGESLSSMPCPILFHPKV